MAMFERRQTRQIMVGTVPVGGDAPVTVQSMTITKTADVEGTLQQIYALAAAGCDIVRCTCNETEAADETGFGQGDDENREDRDDPEIKIGHEKEAAVGGKNEGYSDAALPALSI